LPVLVIIGLFALGLRLTEIAVGFETKGIAFAVEETEAEPPPMDAQQRNASESEAIDSAGPPGALERPDIEWRDATEAEFEFSEVKEDIYRDLVARRESLEQQTQELSMREALLSAAEREVEQKLRELTAVRDEISALLEQQTLEEEGRISSLVKIYEGMKAKDAARIFNTLDIDVLLSVFARMSERKSAPIMAEMTPDRARTVTILLAQQKQLPAIPPQ